LNTFALIFEFNADGHVEKVVPTESSELAVCILKTLSEVQAAKSPLIAPSVTHPPHELVLEIDPTDFMSLASKK